MEGKNWNHTGKYVNIIERQEKRTRYIYAYTDGSKNDIRVGSGIAIFSDQSNNVLKIQVK
jgi:hypothetical protein